MADFGHPHVMILGQSFVHHLDQFIRRFQSSMKVKCNFNIQDKCQVSLLGIGGQTVGKIIVAKLHFVTSVIGHACLICIPVARPQQGLSCNWRQRFFFCFSIAVCVLSRVSE